MNLLIIFGKIWAIISTNIVSFLFLLSSLFVRQLHKFGHIILFYLSNVLIFPILWFFAWFFSGILYWLVFKFSALCSILLNYIIHFLKFLLLKVWHMSPFTPILLFQTATVPCPQPSPCPLSMSTDYAYMHKRSLVDLLSLPPSLLTLPCIHSEVLQSVQWFCIPWS